VNETVCPSTQKFPLPSNELLPVSQITLANTEADGNKNCNSILDPIVESDMVETVRAEISSALQDDTSKRGRKVLGSKVGAKAGSFKAGEVGVATGTNRVSRLIMMTSLENWWLFYLDSTIRLEVKGQMYQ